MRQRSFQEAKNIPQLSVSECTRDQKVEMSVQIVEVLLHRSWSRFWSGSCPCTRITCYESPLGSRLSTFFEQQVVKEVAERDPGHNQGVKSQAHW